MYVPALAARAPLGATNAATGTGDARIALMMSRIERSRPPGVSICSTTSCARSFPARASPRSTKSALDGPIAPVSGITMTEGEAATAASARPSRTSAAARTKASVRGLCCRPSPDVGLVDIDCRLLVFGHEVSAEACRRRLDPERVVRHRQPAVCPQLDRHLEHRAIRRKVDDLESPERKARRVLLHLVHVEPRAERLLASQILAVLVVNVAGR